MKTMKLMTSLFVLAMMGTSVLARAHCGCRPAPAPAPCKTTAAPCQTTQAPCKTTRAPCATTTLKPKVYVNTQQPIVINRKAQSYVINAPPAVLIKTAPVVLQRPGHSEYRPFVKTVTSKPQIVHRKIVKIERPVVKKYYEEKYQKTEPAEQDQVYPLPPLPSPCSQAGNSAASAPASAPAWDSASPSYQSQSSYAPAITVEASNNIPVDYQALIQTASSGGYAPAASSGCSSCGCASSPCGCGAY